MKFLNYIKGLRKGKDAHRVELESMYDPFLEEAIEGYDSVNGKHADAIAKLQHRVARKSSARNLRAWFPAVSAAAVLVLVVSYFTLFNKSEPEYTDSSSLYVYVPEEYVGKMQMEEMNVSPVVEIDNIKEILETENIGIYIPEEYLQRKRIKASKGEIQEKQTSTTIINLDEIMAPEAPINIYVPESYSKKKNLDI